MFQFSGIYSSVLTALRPVLDYWWIWLPVTLGLAAYYEWFEYQREAYIAGIKWVLLEIMPPPDVLHTPKIAENLFSGLHATYGGGVSWKSQFFAGKVPDWFSFEIVSDGGEMHFFIRCPETQRNVIEALVFAQYPEAEIRQAEDYLTTVPDKLSLDQYDVYCTELIFTKGQAFPIKTWPEFEEKGGKDENIRIDPLAPLLEIMSALQPGEHMWLQILLRPTGGAWVEEGKKVIDELSGKPKGDAEVSVIGQIISFPFTLIGWILTEFLGGAPAEEKKKEEKDTGLSKLTPGQKKVLELVEGKLARLAFKGGIRYCYVATKESFNGSRTASAISMFKQLYANNLNSFKPNPEATSRSKGFLPWLFPGDKGFGAEARTTELKHKLYAKYRAREFTKDFTILNVEELATLWHLPGLNVRAPLLPRVQAKKGQPPAILPTR